MESTAPLSESIRLSKKAKLSTELVSDSSTAGSNPLPLQTSGTSFPLSIEQLAVASNMLGQTQVVDPMASSIQFSQLVDQINSQKQPRIESTVPEDYANHPYDDDDDDDGKPSSKKTRGRVRIKMEYIQNKLRRYTTFSKRKSGIMKKAYELATLTGTQVMLLVASETGHVYTFATPKLQPMITSENGKALIQTCLNSPDPAFRPDLQAENNRFSQQGFEETELSYAAIDSASPKGMMEPTSTMATMPTHNTVLGQVVRVNPFGMQLPQHQLPIATSQGGNIVFGQQFLPSSHVTVPSSTAVPVSHPSSPQRHLGSPSLQRMSPSHSPYSAPSPMPTNPNMMVDDTGSPPSHMTGSPIRQGSPHFHNDHLLPPLDSYDSHTSPRQQTYSPVLQSSHNHSPYSNHGSPGQMHMPSGHHL